MIQATKFTDTKTSPLEINNPEAFVKKIFASAYIDAEILRHGVYKLLGWRYDLKPYLKRYLYHQYGGWYEAYAPNKTVLRFAVHGKINQIVEIPKI